jgi:hypothetical protein
MRTIPEPITPQEAAAQIVALINSSPRSPRQEEIEAIIARAEPSSVVPTTPLLIKIRETVARLGDAFDAYGKLTPKHPAEDAVQARIDQFESELENLEHQIPSPPQSFADLVAWAEIAHAGAGIYADERIDAAQADDVFERPAARLMEAVLQMGGCSRVLVMSPAHAEHYREWRSLIATHVREFENVSEAGKTKAEITADENRMAQHMELINALCGRIFAVPARTWGDVALYAQVAFWQHWPGVDPEGPEASAEMRWGPFGVGGYPAETVAKLLEAIFTVAGIAQFAEGRP